MTTPCYRKFAVWACAFALLFSLVSSVSAETIVSWGPAGDIVGGNQSLANPNQSSLSLAAYDSPAPGGGYYPAAAGATPSFYGGAYKFIQTASNPSGTTGGTDWYVENTGGNDRLYLGNNGPSDTTFQELYGLHLWAKEDFLAGSGAGSLITLQDMVVDTRDNSSGVNSKIRFVVQLNNGNYYASEEFGEGVRSLGPPAAATWYAYDPVSDLNAIAGSAAALSESDFEGLTAVGVFRKASSQSRFVKNWLDSFSVDAGVSSEGAPTDIIVWGGGDITGSNFDLGGNDELALDLSATISPTSGGSYYPDPTGASPDFYGAAVRYVETLSNPGGASGPAAWRVDNSGSNDRAWMGYNAPSDVTLNHTQSIMLWTKEQFLGGADAADGVRLNSMSVHTGDNGSSINSKIGFVIRLDDQYFVSDHFGEGSQGFTDPTTVNWYPCDPETNFTDVGLVPANLSASDFDRLTAAGAHRFAETSGRYLQNYLNSLTVNGTPLDDTGPIILSVIADAANKITSGASLNDPKLPMTISGTGNPGATVTVKAFPYSDAFDRIPGTTPHLKMDVLDDPTQVRNYIGADRITGPRISPQDVVDMNMGKIVGTELRIWSRTVERLTVGPDDGIDQISFNSEDGQTFCVGWDLHPVVKRIMTDGQGQSATFIGCHLTRFDFNQNTNGRFNFAETIFRNYGDDVLRYNEETIGRWLRFDAGEFEPDKVIRPWEDRPYAVGEYVSQPSLGVHAAKAWEKMDASVQGEPVWSRKNGNSPGSYVDANGWRYAVDLHADTLISKGGQNSDFFGLVLDPQPANSAFPELRVGLTNPDKAVLSQQFWRVDLETADMRSNIVYEMVRARWNGDDKGGQGLGAFDGPGTDLSNSVILANAEIDLASYRIGFLWINSTGYLANLTDTADDSPIAPPYNVAGLIKPNRVGEAGPTDFPSWPAMTMARMEARSKDPLRAVPLFSETVTVDPDGTWSLFVPEARAIHGIPVKVVASDQSNPDQEDIFDAGVLLPLLPPAY